MSDSKRGPIPLWANFAIGGISGCSATVCVHPLDVIRIRIQTEKAKSSFTRVASNLIKEEGLAGAYTGLSAGLVRQLTYGLTKFGAYNQLTQKVKQMNGGENYQIPFVMKVGCGLTAGGLAACVGNPAEIALVRMTADRNAPVEQRRGYTGVFNALGRVAREEGPATLWRGLPSHINRAALLTAAQLATFSQAKDALAPVLPFGGVGLTFCATLVSGFCATVASLPMDVIKTRLQNMRIVDGKPEFTGTLDCLGKIVKAEGPSVLFKGFLPSYVKLAPYSTIALMANQQLKSSGYFNEKVVA